MWGRPDILWGLLALSIPIALHLLQLRRFKRVAFSNVAFLKDVQKETRSRHRLRNLLILLARLLAFALVIMAFADPMLAPEKAADNGGQQAVSIYVDSSPSMMASGESGPLIQVAKQKATALVEAFRETDKYHVFASDFAGVDQRFMTQDEALERIAAIQLSTQAPSLEAVVQRGLDQLQRAPEASGQGFWISDLQKSSHNLQRPMALDSTVNWHVLPVEANKVPNIWIDSVWFGSPLALPDQPAALHVRIGHDALEGMDGLPLSLRLDGVPAALGSYHLVPGLPTDTVLRFTHGAPGPHHLKVELEDAPVQFDDAHFMGYNVEERVEIFHWTSANAPFRAASLSVQQALESANPLLGVERGSALPSPQRLAAFDLVVVDALEAPSSGEASMLEAFQQQGGTLLLIPDSSAVGMTKWMDGLTLGNSSGWVRGEGQVATVRWSHPLYEGVFRSIPSRVDWPTYDRILDRRPGPREEWLVRAANGLPYLSVVGGAEAEGDVYILGTSLETGNLTRHGLFVPTMLRIAESSRKASHFALELGKDASLTLALDPNENGRMADDLNWRIRRTDLEGVASSNGAVPEMQSTSEGLKLGWGESLQEPGGYDVLRNNDKVASFGLNHRSSESLMDIWLPEEWTAQVEALGWPTIEVWRGPASQLKSLVDERIAGQRLAWYFFVGALCALALETLLLRKWNKLFS